MKSIDPPGGAHEADEQTAHVPVLLKKLSSTLNVRPGGDYADATLGWPGTRSEIARRLGAKGRLICFDRDPEAMEAAKARLEEVARGAWRARCRRWCFEPRAFSEASETDRAGKPGWSAGGFRRQQPAAGRGAQRIQFSADGPLDMRMDTRSGETAEQVVNQADENELADLIYEFGEERRSRRIARAIVQGPADNDDGGTCPESYRPRPRQ